MVGGPKALPFLISNTVNNYELAEYLVEANEPIEVERLDEVLPALAALGRGAAAIGRGIARGLSKGKTGGVSKATSPVGSSTPDHSWMATQKFIGPAHEIDPDDYPQLNDPQSNIPEIDVDDMDLGGSNDPTPEVPNVPASKPVMDPRGGSSNPDDYGDIGNAETDPRASAHSRSNVDRGYVPPKQPPTQQAQHGWGGNDPNQPQSTTQPARRGSIGNMLKKVAYPIGKYAVAPPVGGMIAAMRQAADQYDWSK